MQSDVVLVYDKRRRVLLCGREESKMEWISLESRQNPAVKLCASLEQKKARDENDLFVAEGKTLFFDFAQKGLFPQKVFLSQKLEKMHY